MKTKIYKVLSVVLAIAMLLSTCISAITTVSASTAVVPTMVNGTIDGNSGTVSYQTHRIYTQDLLAVADYESLTIGTGYKAYYHFYDSEGTWKNSSGTWINPGTYDVATMTGISSGATHFRVTIALTGNEDLSPDLPEGAFALVPVPVEPKTATYFVSAAGNDENDGLKEETAVATYGKALELAAAAYGAKDQVTVKLMGESVDLGTVPAYAFDLTTEGVETTATTLSSTGSSVLVAKGSGITRFRNVKFVSSSQYATFMFGDSKNVILESTVSGFNAMKYFALGTYNDGGAATTVAGQTCEINQSTPVFYLGSAGWHQKTFTEDVNLTFNGGGTPDLNFNPATNCTIYYKKNLNLNIKNAAGIKFTLKGTLKMDGAIQIINSASAAITGLDTVVKTIPEGEGTTTTPVDKYILNNKTGNADILSFTDTAGKYAVDTARYTVTATPVAGGEAIVAKDGFLEVPAGEYNITATKNVETVTYTAQTGAEIATVAAAVEKAIADGYMAKDTVIVKVAGESVELGTLPAYPFDLVVESAVPETKTTILCGTSSIVLANNEGATTSYKNVTLSNSSTEWKSAISNSSNISFDEKVTFSFGYGTSIYFGTGNDGGANKYIAGQSLYLASANLPYRVNLANGSWSGRKYTEDVNVTVDNAAISPIFQFNSYYSSQASGTTQYQKNLNFILKSAKGIGFEYLDGVTYGTGIQIINNAGITIGETTTGFASLPADKTWVINNNTEDKELIAVTETAGKFAVNADEGAVVKATPVAGGDAIEAIDGYLTLPAGQYNIGAKLPAKRTDNYVDHIAYRTALNGNNALNNVAAKWNKGEDINVVYYGGSVTAGSGASDADTTSWRGIIGNWLTENAPAGTTVNNINSAIGGTGSQFGIYRLKEAVLDKQPDLLFIEFSINDYYDNQVTPCDEKEAAKRFETIIYEVRKALPNCDIVTVLTTEKALIASNKEGGMHKQANGHDAVAKEYGIPTLYVGKALANHLPADWEAVWSEYMTDIVHPTDKGYEVYANVVTEYISNSLLFDNAEATEIKAHVMPEVLYSKDLIDGNIQVYEVSEEMAAASETLGGDKFTVSTGDSRIKYFDNYFDIANTTVAFEFTGTELGVVAQYGESGSGKTYDVVITKKDGGEEVFNGEVKVDGINPGFIAKDLPLDIYVAKITGKGEWARFHGFTTRDANQKTVQVLPEGREYTYYVSETGSDETGDGTDAKPFATVAKAIEKANEVRKYATDTVIVKVCGTAVTLGTFPQHVFNLVVESNDTAGITTVNFGAGAMLANNEGAKTTYKNVTLAADGDWKNAYLASGNVVFGEGSTLSGSFLTVSYGTGNDGGAAKTIAGQSAEFNCATPYAIILANGSWSGRTYSEDVNLVVNNANSNPFIAFNSYYQSAKSGTTKYKKNVNINLKSAKGVRLYQLDGTTFEGAVQIIDSAGLGFDAVYESTVTSAADPSMRDALANVPAAQKYFITNKTGDANGLEFTETAGKYKVNVDDAYIVKAIDANGNVIETKDGYLTVSAGEYEVIAEKIPAYGEYYVQANATEGDGTEAKPFATINEAIAAANADGYIKGDYVTIKVLGTDAVSLVTADNYAYKLIITSAVDKAATVNLGEAGSKVAYYLTGDLEFDNITVTETATTDKFVVASGYNLTFGAGTTTNIGQVNSTYQDTSTSNDFTWTINNAYTKDLHLGYYNRNGITHKGNVNVIVDNAAATPKFSFMGYWGGKGTINGNLTIFAKNAGSVTINAMTNANNSSYVVNGAAHLIVPATAQLSDTSIANFKALTANHYVLKYDAGLAGLIEPTKTAGVYEVDFVSDAGYRVEAIDENGNITKAVDGLLTLTAGVYDVVITRDPINATYYVETGADGTADTYATIADAITAANENGLIAKDTLTIKLKGESVEFGAIPAYKYNLVIESNDPAVRTKATFNKTGGTIANNKGGLTTYKNVEINNDGGEWKALLLNGTNVVFDENCKFALGYGTSIVFAVASDGDGAKSYAGQNVEINCALPYGAYISAYNYAATTYTEPVNYVVNGTGTAYIMFNAAYNGAENGTTTYKDQVNVFINNATAIQLGNMGKASFEGGLHIFNNTNIEITEETLVGDASADIKGILDDGQSLPENTWILNNPTGKQLIAPDKGYAGIFEVLVDTESINVYAKDAEGVKYEAEEGFIYLDEVPGIYTIYAECTTHDWGEATCTEAAKCKVCGTENEEMPALDHDMQDPTCTEPSKCSRCDYTEGEALGHEFLPENYVSDNNATCTEDGTKTAKCTRCDVTDTIPDEGTAAHTFVDYIFDEGSADCVNDGTKTATCEYCDATETITAENTALGHSFVNYIYNEDAECEKDGTETATCDRCDETDTRDKVDSALGHSFVDYIYNEDAECEKDGTETATCDRCEETDTRDKVGTALGHDMQPASCTEASKCSRCDHTEGEALGHDMQPASCTEASKCSRCDYTEGEALGHEFVNHICTRCEARECDGTNHTFDQQIATDDYKAGDADCLNPKSYYKSCVCGAKSTTETFTEGEALGHDMQPASCTEASKCSRCDHTEGEALGHNFGEYKYNEGSAKCGVDGTKTAECDRCDATDTITAEGTALAHSYVDYVYDEGSAKCGVDGTETAECANGCGETDTRTAVGTALEHKYENHVYNNDATCTKDGTKTATCSNGCGTKNTVIAVGTKLAHKNVTVLTKKATLSANGVLTTKCSVCGTVAKTTAIAKIASVKTTAKITYNGKKKTPSVTVKDANGKVIGSGNYTVKYASGRKNYGKYKITVTFKGNYSGSKVIYFEIVPKNSKVSKLTAAKKSLKVKLSRQKKATGYQIQYSTSKTFKSAKTVTLKKNSITSKTIKKLKAKKTYYVRVRTYKTYKGKKYYSAWSAAKKKKTK